MIFAGALLSAVNTLRQKVTEMGSGKIIVSLQEKIFTNRSSRAAEVVKEDIEFMGPVRVSDVESAQQRIVDIVRRLEDSGEIVISGRGGAQDVVV